MTRSLALSALVASFLVLQGHTVALRAPTPVSHATRFATRRMFQAGPSVEAADAEGTHLHHGTLVHEFKNPLARLFVHSVDHHAGILSSARFALEQIPTRLSGFLHSCGLALSGVVQALQRPQLVGTTIAACLVVAFRHCIRHGPATNPFHFALLSIALALQLISLVTGSLLPGAGDQ
mmetsp:Transcript_21326/g.71739  ORF Transcript_21326/g.71739 Transcript_21326/m.71739 type:complete len:178 (-) Transcript_21326:94-627(-)